MKLSEQKRIRHAVEQGGWVDNIAIDGFEGIALKVRGMGNADYNRMYSDLAAALPPEKKNADGTPVDAEAERIMIECLKRTVLVAWKGIEDEFSADAVDGIFADPDLAPAWRAAVLYAARSMTRGVREAIEADAKN